MTETEKYSIKIGIKLRKVLDKQKENVRKVTLDCVKVSDYEAGELIAKKIIENKLV